jgi:hypothetical protein
VNGEIGAVTAHGTDRFVWSGTVEGDGSFYMSYAEGAIIGDVYYPSRGVQYEYRPLDRAEGSYSLRAVPMNVYDEEPEEIRAHDLLGRTGPLRSGADWAELAETPHLRGVSAQSTDTNGVYMCYYVFYYLLLYAIICYAVLYYAINAMEYAFMLICTVMYPPHPTSHLTSSLHADHGRDGDLHPAGLRLLQQR